jgi:hypothetical protein
MRARMTISLCVLLAFAGLTAAVALGSSSFKKGSYKGHATNGTTSSDNKSKAFSFDVKVVTKYCQHPGGTFTTSLCLVMTEGSSLPVVCEDSNSADPTPRPSSSRRSIPTDVAVPKTGRVDITIQGSTGNGVTTNNTRLVVALKGGKASGYVSYDFHGRSVIINSDCTGRLNFTAKHVGR